MTKILRNISLAVVLLAAASWAVVIDFDALEVANASLNYINSGTYVEDGFTITGSPMYYAGQNLTTMYAGSAGMHMRSSGAAINLALSAGNGAAFDLNNIDLSILHRYGVSPAVTFRAYNAANVLVASQSFLPNVFGFQSFAFGSGFQGISKVVWNQGGYETSAHQFDNIVVNESVPEPATLALLAIGLLGLAGIKKFRA